MTRKRSYRLIPAPCWALAALLALAAVEAQIGAGSEATAVASMPEFELSDQFGRRVAGSELRHRLVLLIGGDRKGSDASQAWGAAAAEHLAAQGASDRSIRLVRVADLRAFPRVLEPVVVKKLRRDRDVGILLDWRGELAGHYEFQPGVANVLLIDESGRVAHSFHGGSPDAHSRKALLGAVDAALATPAAIERPEGEESTPTLATAAKSDV